MRRIVLLVVVLGLVQVAANGQSGKESMELWLERVADEYALQMETDVGEEALDEIMESLQRLLERPLDINRVTRSQLEQIPLLSDFQIESLLEYRQNSGPILSKTELGLINGFDPQSATLLEPLFYFNPDNFLQKKGSSTTLLLKGWWKPQDREYIGQPFYSQIKYKTTIKGKFQAGCTLEKDYGELTTAKGQIPLGDFFSFHAQGKDFSLGRNWKVSNIILGDYTIKMGQGLAAWSSGAIFTESSVQGARKRGETVAPYTSSDENAFFRGGALTLQRKLAPFSYIEGTGFFSLKKVDARRDGIKYTSLPTDGLHNTASLMKTRKTMAALAYGATVAAKWSKGKVGVNWLGYGYNLHNGRKVQEYNKYQMYNGQWGNFSADFALLVGKIKLFAEAAMDYGGGFAILAGAIAKINGWECSILGRSYAKDYIAPYANAYSTISSCSNQKGVAITFQKNISREIKLSGGGDYTHYPWVRYNIPAPSAAAKVWGKAECTSEAYVWNIKLYESWSSYGNTHKVGANGSYALYVAPWLRLRAKGAVVSNGFKTAGAYISADAKMQDCNGRFSAILQGVYYNCRDWENRLYMHEQDLPSTFASRLLYGTGLSWYALLSCKIGKIWSLYLKIDNLLKLKTGIRMRFF